MRQAAQAGDTHDQKVERGERLKTAAASLPEHGCLGLPRLTVLQADRFGHHFPGALPLAKQHC